MNLSRRGFLQTLSAIAAGVALPIKLAKANPAVASMVTTLGTTTISLPRKMVAGRVFTVISDGSNWIIVNGGGFDVAVPPGGAVTIESKLP